MLWKGLQLPNRLDFEKETSSDTFGRFTAQPLERGFGSTIGNALRRVLLSSIEGTAVATVKIEGATFPNYAGTEQKRQYVVSGDQLTIINQSSAVGGVVKIVLTRAK